MSFDIYVPNVLFPVIVHLSFNSKWSSGLGFIGVLDGDTNAFLPSLEISPYCTSETHLPFFTATAYWQLTVILWSAREFRSLSSWWFLTDELTVYSSVFVLLVPEWLTLYFVLLDFILLLFLSISRLSDSSTAISPSSSLPKMCPGTGLIRTSVHKSDP